jgi:hypothetical protein
MKGKTIVNNPYVIHIIKDRKLGKVFKGVAKCSDNDIFDEVKGTKIAVLKAEIKRDRSKMNNLLSQYNYLTKAVDNELNQIEKRVDMFEERIQKKYEDIEALEY